MARISISVVQLFSKFDVDHGLGRDFQLGVQLTISVPLSLDPQPALDAVPLCQPGANQAFGTGCGNRNGLATPDAVIKPRVGGITSSVLHVLPD
jgi:hypothetical protein